MVWHVKSLRWGLAAVALASWGCQAEVEPLIIESDIVVTVPEAGTEAAQERLRELLVKGTQPGTMEPFERREVEELVLGLMAPTRGSLSGHRWVVKYLDMPGVDFVSAELMRGEGTADRRVWMQLLPMKGKPLSGFEAGDLEPVAGYQARGMLDHHLFVRVGDFDLRIVADKPETRDDVYLRQILLGCRLDEIAAL
ncbi:MAG: hypothetical protein K8J08_00240 [Thermoanaerobaculia bacterium]|nr:hypothetical protein [Thermoanaerobaculia bacterium]